MPAVVRLLKEKPEQALAALARQKVWRAPAPPTTERQSKKRELPRFVINAILFRARKSISGTLSDNYAIV